MSNSLHKQIREDMTAAMKAKEGIKKETLRGVLSAFTNEAVANGKKPDTQLSDEEAQKVLGRLAKQRKESIESFEKGGRNELAEKERKELTVLEEYLPQQLSREEIREKAEKKIAELGVTDKSEMGSVMGALMQEIGSKADGSEVRSVIEELLS